MLNRSETATEPPVNPHWRAFWTIICAEARRLDALDAERDAQNEPKPEAEAGQT